MLNNVHYGFGVLITTISLGYCSKKIYDAKHTYINKIKQQNSQIFKLTMEKSSLKFDNDLLLKFIKYKNLNNEYNEFKVKENEFSLKYRQFGCRQPQGLSEL